MVDQERGILSALFSDGSLKLRQIGYSQQRDLVDINILKIQDLPICLGNQINNQFNVQVTDAKLELIFDRAN